jgi:sister chromatid cohesion protein DCC1
VPTHTLPLEPAARFAHLFALRQKWRPEDMIPFLDPITVNEKERERWVLKHARKVR